LGPSEDPGPTTGGKGDGGDNPALLGSGKHLLAGIDAPKLGDERAEHDIFDVATVK
jgi:hypothetical protein